MFLGAENGTLPRFFPALMTFLSFFPSISPIDQRQQHNHQSSIGGATLSRQSDPIPN
jgi:hypothetical protein